MNLGGGRLPLSRIVKSGWARHVEPYDIRDDLAAGWLALIPSGMYHGSAYGIVMAWVCDCRVLVGTLRAKNKTPAW